MREQGRQKGESLRDRAGYLLSQHSGDRAHSTVYTQATCNYIGSLGGGGVGASAIPSIARDSEVTGKMAQNR